MGDEGDACCFLKLLGVVWEDTGDSVDACSFLKVQVVVWGDANS